MKLSKLTKPELEEVTKNANLTDDEMDIFLMLSRGKGIKEIAFKQSVSTSTVSRRIESIKKKIGGNTLKDNSVPIWEKMTLTLEEAAAYSNIGINKLREISNHPTCNFVVYVGSKRLIKRKAFERFIENESEL